MIRINNRWKVLIITGAVLFTALIGRLAYIQIFGHDELSAAASAQQQIVLEGADTRGTIYDRSGNPIAGQQEEYIYIISSDNFDGETMNALNEIGAEEISGQSGYYRVFSSETYLKSTGERLIRNSDAYIIEAGRRYRENQPAVHVIGYVNKKDNAGASGLELMYNDELAMYAKSVAATADVKGILTRGKGLTVKTAADTDSYIKEGIVTTLDLGLQKKVEAILAECDKDGAIVVTESGTGEIMASASTPVFDPNEVETYIDSSGGEFVNKVMQGEYPPGSVFKIIVAAAALENGMDPDETFYCSGKEIIDGVSVGCSTGGDTGHGNISFAEAFADSCNCAFIQIAEKTGAGDIIEMAEAMGMDKTVLDGYPGEKAGSLMSVSGSSGSAIANLALGQGETLATPLQISEMTVTVANGGVDPGLHLVINDTDITEAKRVISENTAEKLQKMMELTMTEGTGKGLGESMAAKTGSAQSVQSGVQVVHGWMTGYVPADDPKYAITVFVEDGKSGRSSAGPLFAAVSRYLAKSGMIDKEVGL